MRFELIAFGNVKSKKMNLARTVVRTELDTWNHSNSERLGSELRLLKSGECVVIGECDRRESSSACGIDYCRRSERPVGRGRVHVQVDLASRRGGLTC
jgi:hypothetical protein